MSGKSTWQDFVDGVRKPPKSEKEPPDEHYYLLLNKPEEKVKAPKEPPDEPLDEPDDEKDLKTAKYGNPVPVTNNSLTSSMIKESSKERVMMVFAGVAIVALVIIFRRRK